MRPVIVVLVVTIIVVVRVTVVREGAAVRGLALPQLLRSGLGRTLSSAAENINFLTICIRLSEYFLENRL